MSSNPIQTPASNGADVAPSSSNTSGNGRASEIPPGVKGWSWGALLWNWVWAIGNKTWIGLLALVPYIGFGVAIYLGIKGRELAWRNKRWESLDHFNQVQRAWSKWAFIATAVGMALGIIAAIVLPESKQ